MINKITLFFVSLFVTTFCQAQNVIIAGQAKTYENEEIGVWVNRDFISKSERRVTYSIIDSSGYFTLAFDIKNTQYITLKIGKSIASLFVEPGDTLDVLLGQKDPTTYLNPNLEHDVALLIKLKSKVEFNALTMDYDKRFDDFLTNEYRSFVMRKPRPKIDSFKVLVHDFYATVENDYFDEYVIYSIATLEEKVKVSRTKLYDTYLNNKKILYSNPEYFNFFNAFYKHYLRNYSLTKGDTLANQINVKHSFSGVKRLLKAGEYMANDTILELVLIKGLQESYHDRTFTKESIVRVLEHITDESTISESREIAQNVLNSFSKLRPGELAPYFELPDKNGLTHSLDEMRSNKYVYVFFFSQSCTACLQQIEIASSLKNKYAKWVEFVGISLDESTAEFKSFCLKNPSYNWLALHDNTGKKLKADYEIRSLPAYFLIGMDGKFVQAPAESLEGDIDRAFFDISKPKGRKHQVGDRGNR